MFQLKYREKFVFSNNFIHVGNIVKGSRAWNSKNKIGSLVDSLIWNAVLVFLWIFSFFLSHR